MRDGLDGCARKRGAVCVPLLQRGVQPAAGCGSRLFHTFCAGICSCILQILYRCHMWWAALGSCRHDLFCAGICSCVLQTQAARCHMCRTALGSCRHEEGRHCLPSMLEARSVSSWQLTAGHEAGALRRGLLQCKPGAHTSKVRAVGAATQKKCSGSDHLSAHQAASKSSYTWPGSLQPQ